MPDGDPARDEADRAAAEAGAIGRPTSPDPPAAEAASGEAQRPLAEAGQGEAEGFEQAEQELIEHATHGDQHAARRAIEDAPPENEDELASRAGEADHERSSEREEDMPGRE